MPDKKYIMKTFAYHLAALQYQERWNGSGYPQAKHIPLYPGGLTVKLDTGETGIVSNASPGSIGRPVIHICYERNLEAAEKPCDIDLSEPACADRIIAQVPGYD